MPVLYAVKHVFRSWKLFLALLIGVTLASAFFAGIDIKANTTAKQALDQQLSNIYVDMQARISSLSLSQMPAVRDEVLNVTGVTDAEVISRTWAFMEISGENNSARSYGVQVAAIANHSQVYEGWLNRPQDEIGENETYVPEGTSLADVLKVGDVVQVNFTIYISYDNQINMQSNLTVKGFAQLNDKAAAIASAYQPSIVFIPGTVQPPEINADFLLLISWENTMQKILEEMQKYSGYQSIETSVLIYLNRNALINPWDVGTSINNLEVIKNSIENKLATELGAYVTVQNNLEWPLFSFQISSMLIRFQFTIISLPIFFMAWYMGTTVSDVSFNLRRREIGLLSTKGFSRGQILRTFLTETLLIGCIGGILGVILGFLLNPIFTQFGAQAWFNPYLISPYTIAFTISFGIIMALLSTYRSAKKASQLPTVEALREYLPMETEKPYKKRWPWVALILGTYKIAVFLTGINMTEVLTKIIFGGGGNFILILLVGIFLFIDAILNYIGPLLFFWGFTKIFIQGSLEFQQLTARAAKFLGDLGVLATKNVRRNPARSAAIAFLIALIVGYSVQVNGQLASEQDYTVRQIYYSIGADVAVNVAYINNAPQILETIVANFSEYVQNVTIEYSLSASSVAGGINMRLKAVEPNSWQKTAYYENDWFSGSDVSTAFSSLTLNNNTIILELTVARSLDLKIGDNISIMFGSINRKLKVVGFFGPEPSDQQSPIFTQLTNTYWSFISQDFYEEISSYAGSSAKILIKLKGGANEEYVADSIRDMNSNISSVESFAEEWEKTQTNVLTMGVLDVQKLGIVFAVLAASVGTALVSVVSMKERSREAAIMSVKGLSYKQLVIMFLTENLALVMFSVILGVLVGFIIVYGNISASNAVILDIVKRRLVFPLDSTLMMTSSIALIFAATILPILIMSRRYVTKLERMVRLR
jgi:ABC-type lipoprotein release transport system permease subunit